MKKTIATSLIVGSLAFGAGSFGKVGEPTVFDDKGLTDVKVQVLIKNENFQDAVYYTPEEWSLKTKEDIETEKLQRFNDWKRFVDEQSKLVAPIEDEML
jgi:hypothetical protein